MINAMATDYRTNDQNNPVNTQQQNATNSTSSANAKQTNKAGTVDTGRNTGDIFNGKDLNKLGKSEFLKLLIAQLSKQNPLNPVDDKEFIAQMAEFSALEQMQNVSAGMGKLSREIKSFKDQNIKTMQNLESYSLLGKKVTGFDLKSQSVISGDVKSVYRDNSGAIYVQIENHGEIHDLKLSHVTKAESSNSVSRETIVEPTQKQAAETYKEHQEMNSTKGEQTK